MIIFTRLKCILSSHVVDLVSFNSYFRCFPNLCAFLFSSSFLLLISLLCSLSVLLIFTFARCGLQFHTHHSLSQDRLMFTYTNCTYFVLFCYLYCLWLYFRGTMRRLHMKIRYPWSRDVYLFGRCSCLSIYFILVVVLSLSLQGKHFSKLNTDAFEFTHKQQQQEICCDFHVDQIRKYLESLCGNRMGLWYFWNKADFNRMKYPKNARKQRNTLQSVKQPEYWTTTQWRKLQAKWNVYMNVLHLYSMWTILGDQHL